MPEFSEPTVGVAASRRAAMAEFQAEGRGSADDATMVGREIRRHAITWDTPEGFAAYVRELRFWVSDS